MRKLPDERLILAAGDVMLGLVWVGGKGTNKSSAVATCVVFDTLCAP